MQQPHTSHLLHLFLALVSLAFDSVSFSLFIVTPKHTRSTAHVASKKPHRVTDLEVKLEMIEHYEGGK